MLHAHISIPDPETPSGSRTESYQTNEDQQCFLSRSGALVVRHGDASWFTFPPGQWMSVQSSQGPVALEVREPGND